MLMKIMRGFGQSQIENNFVLIKKNLNNYVLFRFFFNLFLNMLSRLFFKIFSFVVLLFLSCSSGAEDDGGGVDQLIHQVKLFH